MMLTPAPDNMLSSHVPDNRISSEIMEILYWYFKFLPLMPSVSTGYVASNNAPADSELWLCL